MPDPLSLHRRVLSFAKRHFLPARVRFSLARVARPVIIQVGANDGLSHDHVIHLIARIPKASFVLIEPLPDAFSKLEKRHSGNPRVKVLNVAVDCVCGRKDIFYIDHEATRLVPGLPAYFDLLASFSREHVAALIPSHLQADLVRTCSVDCLTLEQILLNTQVADVHALFIDCEGWDLVVLRTFPFHAMRPKVVLIENNHLDRDEYRETCSWMRGNGYKMETYGMDTLFVLARP